MTSGANKLTWLLGLVVLVLLVVVVVLVTGTGRHFVNGAQVDSQGQPIQQSEPARNGLNYNVREYRGKKLPKGMSIEQAKDLLDDKTDEQVKWGDFVQLGPDHWAFTSP